MKYSKIMLENKRLVWTTLIYRANSYDYQLFKLYLRTELRTRHPFLYIKKSIIRELILLL
jgi:hypothetical protein